MYRAVSAATQIAQARQKNWLLNLHFRYVRQPYRTVQHFFLRNWFLRNWLLKPEFKRVVRTMFLASCAMQM